MKLAKLRPIMPEGGFFIMADTSAHGDEVIDEKYRSQVYSLSHRNKDTTKFLVLFNAAVFRIVSPCLVDRHLLLVTGLSPAG